MSFDRFVQQVVDKLNEPANKGTRCSRCGTDISNSDERHKIDGKEVCDKCYFDELGAFVEDHAANHLLGDDADLKERLLNENKTLRAALEQAGRDQSCQG